VLARVLAMVLCLCPCLFNVCSFLSQVGILSKRMDGSSCFFGTEATFDLSYTMLQGTLGI